MSAVLASLAVLLAFAGGWQLMGERGERAGSVAWRLASRMGAGRVRSMTEAALALGLPVRLERAGLAGRFSPPQVLAAKGAGTLIGFGCAALALPALPARLGVIAAPLLAVAGFMGPDAYLERTARLRAARLVAALPDALDLLAVGAAAGRTPATVMREIAGAGRTPLAAELAVAIAELDCGVGQATALEGLRDRVPGGELGALATALERSRVYGSPLAEQLHEQASALRRYARRRIEESASRAAPKIQLVVALVLVPSVLLMILAAIIAHADALFGAF